MAKYINIKLSKKELKEIIEKHLSNEMGEEIILDIKQPFENGNFGGWKEEYYLRKKSESKYEKRKRIFTDTIEKIIKVILLKYNISKIEFERKYERPEEHKSYWNLSYLNIEIRINRKKEKIDNNFIDENLPNILKRKIASELPEYINMELLEKEIEEKTILEELNNIIKEIGEEIYFNIGGPKEQKLCLEKINNAWQVYYVEKSVKLYREEFETLYDACLNALDRLLIDKKYKEIYEKKLGRK